MRFASLSIHSRITTFALIGAFCAVALLTATNSSYAAVKAKKPVVHAKPAVSSSPLILLQTSKGPILIKLFPKDAPISCANFLSLVKSGFYNGLMFHRVTDLGSSPGDAHIVQGGDPNSRHAQPGDPSLGQGGSSKNIKGEFSSNGVANPLLHNAGAVAMARSQDNDSASSQFYICTTAAHALDGNYAVFGYVIKGLDNAAKIVVGDRIVKASID